MYEKEYLDRLAAVPPKNGYEDLQMLKNNLFELRMHIAKLSPSENWSQNHLEKVCRAVKNNKAPNNEELIYELFKPLNCGNDLISSLTKLFNNIKCQQKIPSFLQSMSITSIYKGKGPKNLLRNERGIFNLSKIRSLLDKLLFNDIYETVDNSLSCSNAGGRRGRGIRDQLFIIYGLMTDVVYGKSENMVIQSIDVVQCFDKLNFAEMHNDLWDTQIKDDKFALIVNLDKTSNAIIRTPVGESKPLKLNDTIMQGSVSSSLKCSTQVDTLGRDCLNDDSLTIYKYKSIVNVPPLSFVDDVLGVSKCGVDAIELNAAINIKMETKNLTLGPDKCAKLHIRKKNDTSNCDIKLKVHDEPMKSERRLKYLGDILTVDANIDETIVDRSTRAIGLRSQLKSLLSSISLGSFFFEISLIYRESMYLNSILINCEAWYYISKKNMELLEAADVLYFQTIFNSHTKTVRDSYYLETGKLKLRHMIALRRLMFLHNILKGIIHKS